MRLYVNQSRREILFLSACFWLLIFVLFVKTFQSHINLLSIRIPRDSGAFLTIADGVLHGYLPYKDLIDHKPPGIYYLLAAVLAIDRSIYAARILLLIVNLLTVAGLVMIGRKLWSLEAGIVSGLLYYTTILYYQGYFVLTEPFAVVFLVGALFSLSQLSESHRWAFPAGFFAMTAVVFRLSTGPLFLVLLGFVLAPAASQFTTPRSTSLLALLKEIPEPIRRSNLYFVGGTSIPFILTIGYFTVNGAIDEFIQWVVLANGTYQPNSVGEAGVLLKQRFRAAWPIWGSAVLAMIVTGFERRSNRRWSILFTVLLLLSAIPLAIRQYHHYFIQLLPFTALLIGSAVNTGGDILSTRINSLPTKSCVRMTAILVFLLTLSVWQPIVFGMGTVNSGMTVEDQRIVSDSFQERTDPHETILVFPAEPQYYFLSHRFPPDRNVYYLPINRGISYSDSSVVSVIRRHKPAAIVTRNCDLESDICTFIQNKYVLSGEYQRGIQVWTT